MRPANPNGRIPRKNLAPSSLHRADSHEFQLFVNSDKLSPEKTCTIRHMIVQYLFLFGESAIMAEFRKIVAAVKITCFASIQVWLMK